jgi:hypothetical protein
MKAVRKVDIQLSNDSFSALILLLNNFNHDIRNDPSFQQYLKAENCLMLPEEKKQKE